MEGALLGVPSIALSQAYGGAVGRPRSNGTPPQTHAAPVVRTILAAGIAPGGLVNVNFPACPASEVAGIELTRQGRRNTELMRVEERRDGRGFPYYWLMFQRGALRAGGRHRPRGARGQEDLDHAAQARPHRQRFAPAIRGGVCER